MAYLDNFTETENSNNQILLIVDGEELLYVGATCTHYFKLPFVYSTYANACIIHYKQGINLLFTKLVTSAMVTDDGVISTVKVTLSPTDTLKFQPNSLFATIWAELETKQGAIEHYGPWCVKIIKLGNNSIN